MAGEPKCILSVDVEALPMRAPDRHVDRLIYGRDDAGREWGIGRMMDIADRHNVRMTFFLDFAETELYGEEILQAGRYIAARGHDLQVHCHYKFLEEKVRERFPNAGKSYYTWYEDEAVSGYIVDHCLEQYRRCTENSLIVFRGGEYRLGKELLISLKEKGAAADASYHCMRPLKKPVHKQFVFENGLPELPAGVIPEMDGRSVRALNFNEAYLYPVQMREIDSCLEEYDKLFRSFYACYGSDALAVMLMHGWSFSFEKERFRKTGYIDRPNPYAAELFDRFLTYFKEKIDFITMAQAVEGKECGFDKRKCFNKHIRFDEVFYLPEERAFRNELERMEERIRQRAGDRKIVIWGKGWIEARIMRVRELHLLLDAEYYISRDAAENRSWRGKQVKTFEEAELSPDKDYVLLIANTCFPEIRERLREAGFREDRDYYDAAMLLKLQD